MKILLTGKNGQVGHELQHSLRSLGEVIALDRTQCDLANPEMLRETIRSLKPDVIVNAAAYTAVDKAESEPELAHAINATALEILGEEAKHLNALIIHYSTDYVFDGNKPTPYTEGDQPNPLSVYGTSKLAGEQALQVSGANHLIFRTSWVFGVHGNNFIKTILRLSKERDHLDVVADQHGAPTSAELLADITAQAIPAFFNIKLPSGIYHLTPTGDTTWHKLACHVINCARQSVTTLLLKEEQIRAIPTMEYPTAAKRPMNSKLNTSLLANELGLTLPNWQVHVDRVVGGIMQEAQL